jgi:hypothetical protein
MEWVVIHFITYRTGGNQSHNLWNWWESISQLMEWVVINHTKYVLGGNQSHKIWNGW